MSLNTTIYEDAFNSELSNIWSNTPFKDELKDLSLKRALNSFMKNTTSAIDQRRELIYSYLKPAFSVDDSNDLLRRFKYRLPTTNTLFKRVIRNLCNLYGQPERAISENLESDLSDLGFNSIMKSAYEFAKASGEFAIRPLVVNGKLTFYTYQSDSYRYKLDEFGNITEVWIAYTVSRETNKQINSVKDIAKDYENRFQVWTNDTYKVVDENLSILEEEPNRYGVIPIVFLNLGLWHDFHDAEFNMWNLGELQLQANQLDLLTDENLIFGTLGTWLATNISSPDKTIKLGSGRYVNASHRDATVMPPTLEYITAESEYLNLRDTKESIVKENLKNFGLPTAVIDNRTDLSGIAMKLDRMELEELRGEDEPLLRAYETKLFEMIYLVTDIDSIPYPKEDFRITYEDQSSLSAEEFEHLNNLYTKGFISLAEFGRKCGMSGTNEEILEQINNNKDQNDTSIGGGNEPLQSEAEPGISTGENIDTGNESSTNNEPIETNN